MLAKGSPYHEKSRCNEIAHEISQHRLTFYFAGLLATCAKNSLPLSHFWTLFVIRINAILAQHTIGHAERFDIVALFFK